MTLRTILIYTVAIATVTAGASYSRAAQTVETGFLNRAVTIQGVEYDYQVYLPRDFRKSASWPVILALPGSGGYGDDGILQTAGGLANAIRQHAERFPAIVVFAQSHADGTPGWQTQGGQAALAELDKAIADFHGDPTRVYLTGLSAGANGAWYLAAHHVDRFAALLVISGWILEHRGASSGVLYPALNPAAKDPYAALARMTATIPTWIFHGASDQVASVEESRKMFAALQAVGANVQYTELPGVEHNAWDAAYARPDVIGWMLQQRRPPDMPGIKESK